MGGSNLGSLSRLRFILFSRKKEPPKIKINKDKQMRLQLSMLKELDYRLLYGEQQLKPSLQRLTFASLAGNLMHEFHLQILAQQWWLLSPFCRLLHARVRHRHHVQQTDAVIGQLNFHVPCSLLQLLC